MWPSSQPSLAPTVVAVDILDSKLEMARKFGATHTINSAKGGDLAAE